MAKARRNELKYQSHLVDSYKAWGGTAHKWATDLNNGVPDIVATLPNMGLHLIEVKHRPEFGVDRDTMPNPMDSLQRHVCSEYAQGGGLVILCVIGGGEPNALSSRAYFYPVWLETVNALSPVVMLRYDAGSKYSVSFLALHANKFRWEYKR